MANVKLIGFLVYLIFGLYFINSALEFIALPDFLDSVNKWIILVGGILIVIGGINSLRAGKKKSFF
jgi:hypothetical protein